MISAALRALSITARREIIATGLLAFALLTVGSGAAPIMGRDESRFAQAAREMLETGELVVPTFGGTDRYDKPILIYWCTMASYRVLGINERAARLPSNIAGALTAALLAWAARRRYGPAAGVVAGLLLTVTVTFHVQARGCTADLVMMLPGLAAMLALIELWEGRGKATHAVLLWVGLALALLAKGPVAPAFLACTILAWWALGRAWPKWQLITAAILLALGWWRLGPIVLVAPAAFGGVSLVAQKESRERLTNLRLWWGVPLLLMLVLPWSIAAYTATDGAFYEVGVGRHVVARSLTALESHGGFPGFFPVTGALAAFPWFLLLIPVTRSIIKAWPADSETRLLAAWVVGPLLMLELVQTKLVHYWMLSYPAAILLVVGWLLRDDEDSRALGPALRWTIAATGALLALVPVIVTSRLELEGLQLAAIATGLPLLAGALQLGGRAGISPLRSLLVLCLATALYLVVLLTLLVPALGSFMIGPRAASRALELVEPDEQLLVYKARDDDLFFHLPLDVISCRPRACVEQAWQEDTRFLGIARTADLDRLRSEAPHLPVSVIEEVEGIDLGRVEWSRTALFRIDPRPPMLKIGPDPASPPGENEMKQGAHE